MTADALASIGHPSVPTPGLIASLGSWSWIDVPADGLPVAFFLIAHPPVMGLDETPPTVEQRLLGLAASLGLASPHKTVPDIGPRLAPFGQHAALLRLDGSPHRVRLRADPRWLRLLGEGASAIVALGLDVLPRRAPAADVEAYLDRAVPAGRVLFGATRAE